MNIILVNSSVLEQKLPGSSEIVLCWTRFVKNKSALNEQILECSLV